MDATHTEAAARSEKRLILKGKALGRGAQSKLLGQQMGIDQPVHAVVGHLALVQHQNAIGVPHG